MAASPEILWKEIRRGGKSELRRAGWSVTRTVSVKKRDADFTGTRKVPQKHTALWNGGYVLFHRVRVKR